jgi:hypothetical protein
MLTCSTASDVEFETRSQAADVGADNSQPLVRVV